MDARELGERGLDEALERLRDRLAGGVGYEISLSECLFWIFGLKEILQGRIDFTSKEGKTLKALGWARNYVAHELMSIAHPNYAVSGVLGMGVLGMSRLGGGVGPPIWTADADLPKRKANRAWGRRKLYRKFVGGQPALGPLALAQAYLTSLPR